MAQQLTHPLPVGAHAVGVFLRELVWPRGLEIRKGEPLPHFPRDLETPPLALDFGGLSVKGETEFLDHEALIPLVLVVDCKVRGTSGGLCS